MTAYRFTVPNGSYSVTLKFAELSDHGRGRIFDVKLQGVIVIADLDVMARQAGATWPRTHRSRQPSSTVCSRLSSSTGKAAKVNAIEVIALPPPGPTATPTDGNAHRYQYADHYTDADTHQHADQHTPATNTATATRTSTATQPRRDGDVYGHTDGNTHADVLHLVLTPGGDYTVSGTVLGC